MSAITERDGSTALTTTSPGDVGAQSPDGRSTRWDDHRAVRRADLTHAVRRAVHRRGADLSMDDIAAELGTSKSILYRYFTDKVGLQNAVGEAVVEAIRATLTDAAAHAATPRDSLHAMVDTYLTMIDHSPHVYYFVTRHAAIANSVARPASGTAAQSAPLSAFLHSVIALVAQPFSQEVGVQDAEDTDPATIDAWAAGAVGFVTGTGEWWLSGRDVPGSPDRAVVANQITAWLWAGPGGHLTDRPSPSSP